MGQGRDLPGVFGWELNGAVSELRQPNLQSQGGCLGQHYLSGEAGVLLTPQRLLFCLLRPDEGEGVTWGWGTSLASAVLATSPQSLLCLRPDPTAPRLAVHCFYSPRHLTGPKKYCKRNSVLSDIKSMMYIFAGRAILFDKTAINHNQKNRSKGRSPETSQTTDQ